MRRTHGLTTVFLCALLGCSSESSVGTDDSDSDSSEESESGSQSERRDASADADDDDDDTDDDVDGGSTGSDAGRDAGTSDDDAGETEVSELEHFSFFVTSLKAMQELSGSQSGFGGDLRFGETGDGAGLRGADKICATIADMSMPGASAKQWRAFLSTTTGGTDGGAVNAIDRVGEGPWYDRLGRVVALTKTDLVQVRPASADATIKNDLPNEDGVPNHNPDGTGEVDNHDILTGTNDKGQLYANDVRVTCNDWTKSARDRNDKPRVGHSWPRSGGGGRPGGGGTDNWMSALDEAGCGAGVSLIEMGPPQESNPTVGSGGGYGGIYCFALTP